MKGRTFLFLGSLLVVTLGLQAIDSRDVRRLFAKPPREYATAPLWVWNDRLTEDQVRSTLRDLAHQSVRQVFVHPRPGLMTPYLSDEWFRLWKAALDEAARLDMNVWIYDENSYPSGFAGGWVPEEMPEARGRGLHFKESAEAPAWSPETQAVFRLGDAAAEDVSAQVRSGTALPGGRYLSAVMQRAGNSPWHGNRCYVDLLYPGVTEKFLDVTLDAYQRALGSHFGKRVPGVFTDEPNITPAGGLPWTEDFAKQFESRRGYALAPNLAGLNREVGDWRRVRHDFFRTALELFIERWGKPYYQRCEQLGLQFTGHYWEHEWPHCVGVPDNMAMAAWQHRPGIDTLMNQYAENTHAQFGNIRSVREVASIANQLGRSRTLVELYGAGGWDLRFEDMKRIADWLVVLGINTLDEHLSYVTIRGARKRDHPQSFSYHEPWWDSYGVLATYFTRLCAAMSQGQAIHQILVLEPTSTAWMYQGKEAELDPLGDSFSKFLKSLEAQQIEYDLGCEDVLAREAGVMPIELRAPGPPQLRVGKRAYRVVVLPERTENLEGATVDLLERFVEHGGTVVAAGPPPARVDGQESTRLQKLSSAATWLRTAPSDLPRILGQWSNADGFSVERTPDDRGILFHHRRRLADGDLVLLVNTSLEHPSAGSVNSPALGVEQWDPFTGRTEPRAFDRTPKGTTTAFDVPPGGSLLLFLSSKSGKQLKPVRLETETVTAFPEPTEVERLEPNVLTLDFVDATAGGETRTNVYFYAANQFIWQKNGMERNPWDSAVQFRDELISKQFPPQSGFEARYRFQVNDSVPEDLEIVIERPDLYRITCNGQPVAAANGTWWLDKAFGRIPLAAAARIGENVVTLSARPFTIYHELEPAYVRGHFSLENAERGFVIHPDAPVATEALQTTNRSSESHELSDRQSAWKNYGHPFYSGGVAYRRTYHAQRKQGRYFVRVPSWYGTVAKVRVNGQLAGHLVCAPWECEVTDAIRRGDNTVEVVVVGSLKNTLGPFHASRTRGSAWPGMFQQGPAHGPPPGSSYDTIAYGLFGPIQVRQSTRK